MLSPDPQQWRNPLRDDFDKRLPRIAGPSALVLFGAYGVGMAAILVRPTI